MTKQMTLERIEAVKAAVETLPDTADFIDFWLNEWDDPIEVGLYRTPDFDFLAWAASNDLPVAQERKTHDGKMFLRHSVILPNGVKVRQSTAEEEAAT